MIVAVDPGLAHCGVSVWNDGGELAWAGLVKNPDYVPNKGALCAAPMGVAVCMALSRHSVSELVMEVPQVYPGGRGRAPVDTADLINLACVAGSVLGLIGGHQTVYRPREWKGQLPKEVTTARAMSKLSVDEQHRVNMCSPAGFMHNVWDAVALGLAHLKKTGVRR